MEMNSVTMRVRILRAVLTILGAATACGALYLDHPPDEMPVWFVLSCMMGVITVLCALVSLREPMLRGMAAVASGISALAMILAILIRPQYTDPAPKIGGIVYVIGILIVGVLPWIIERQGLTRIRATVRDVATRRPLPDGEQPRRGPRGHTLS